MTATHAPGLPIVEDGLLVSTNPATGEAAARVPIARADDVAAAVERARAAAAWWAGLGFAGRRTRLLQFRSILANRMPEIADLLRRECGKPVVDGVVETAAFLPHIPWAARNARRVLGLRRVRGSTLVLEFSARVEYQPFGVIGAIGPWNYPVAAICSLAAYALAAGNAMVYKPSEYTPGVSQWLVDRFAEVVPEQPVLQVVHGLGDTGAALCRSGVDKIAFIGSTATGKKVMAACAETLTPLVVECGGKDAMVVDADADLDAAADAALFGACSNAGQTCIGIERVYVASAVADQFIERLVAGARKLKVGVDDDATIGPITMPAQLDTIRRHITDGLADGGTAALGGADAVQPPYVQPTILVEVPEGSAAVREETFGPVLVVNRVRDADEGIARANALPYGLGGSVFAKRRGLELARGMRSGMTAVNSVLSFAGMPSLPYGGVGDSGFGRVHGDDGLREFARPKAITTRRARSLLPASTFARDPAATARRVMAVVRLVHGRSRLPQPPSEAARCAVDRAAPALGGAAGGGAPLGVAAAVAAKPDADSATDAASLVVPGRAVLPVAWTGERWTGGPGSHDGAGHISRPAMLILLTPLRRPRAGARWPSTGPQWRPCASTAPARRRSAWPWGRGGTTRASCLPGRTADRARAGASR